MSLSTNAAGASTPQVVLAFPERARQLLWGHAFGAAGWRTHYANDATDALAVAFNCAADAVVTSYGKLGAAVLEELAKDAELHAVPRYVLLPAGSSLPGNLARGAATFEEPCDPFWPISHLDARLSRVTPSGLGRRPFSESDLDVAIHHWWWGLAAVDLVRQAVRSSRETSDGNALLARMAGPLGRRIDAEVEVVPAHLGRPEGSDLRFLGPGEAGAPVLVAMFGEATRPAAWWRIRGPEDGLTPSHIECICALVSALEALRTR